MEKAAPDKDLACVRREAREAEERFRALIENLDAIVWETNPRDFRVEFLSQRAEEVLGYPHEELMGDPAFWVRVVHPDDRDTLLRVGERIMAGEDSFDFEYRAISADGRVICLRNMVHITRDDDGIPYRARGLAVDVTAQRQAQRRRDAEHEVARALASSTTIGAALPQVLRAVCEQLDWDVGALWLADADQPKLRAVAVWHRPGLEVGEFEDATRGEVFGSRVGLPGRVLATGTHAWVPDVTVDTNFPRAKAAVAVGLHGAFAFPVIVADRVVGVAEFFSHEIRQPDTDLLNMASALGSQIGQFVERRRAEAWLRESRERFASIARTLQRSLLPPHLPEIGGIEVAARFDAVGSGNEVGGDFYDLFETGRDDWAIVVGDVCGKGEEAAALTALARYTIRAAAMQQRQPSKILRLLNGALLNQHPDSDRFVTVAYLRLRRRPGALRATVSCAGHPLPFVARADGVVEHWGVCGTALGMFPEVGLRDIPTYLTVGDVVLQYTDGLTEARGPTGRFGEERVVEVLNACRGDAPEAIADALIDAVRAFRGDLVPSDDLAFVVLRVTE
jgi:PAS domain S-box-containing protein